MITTSGIYDCGGLTDSAICKLGATGGGGTVGIAGMTGMVGMAKGIAKGSDCAASGFASVGCATAGADPLAPIEP